MVPVVIEFKTNGLVFDYFRLSRSGKSVWLGIEGKMGNLEVCDHRPEVVKLVKQTKFTFVPPPEVLTSANFWQEDYEQLMQAMMANARVEKKDGVIHLYEAHDLLANAVFANVSVGPRTDVRYYVNHNHGMLSWFSNQWKDRFTDYVEFVFITNKTSPVGIEIQWNCYSYSIGHSTHSRWMLYSDSIKTYYHTPRWAWMMWDGEWDSK